MKFQQMSFPTNNPQNTRLEAPVEARNFFELVKQQYFVQEPEHHEVMEIFNEFKLYEDAEQMKYVSYGEEVIEVFYVLSHE